MNKHNWWLSIAESDLRLAKKGAEEDSTLNVAIIHTQQCAKKSLKGYLNYHSQPLQRTHDLLKLLDDCIAIDASFVILRNSAAILHAMTIRKFPMGRSYRGCKFRTGEGIICLISALAIYDITDEFYFKPC